MSEFMIGWVLQYQEVFVWIGLLSFLTFLLGLLLVPFVIMRLPEDYFLFHKINGIAKWVWGGEHSFFGAKEFYRGSIIVFGFFDVIFARTRFNGCSNWTRIVGHPGEKANAWSRFTDCGCSNSNKRIKG